MSLVGWWALCLCATVKHPFFPVEVATASAKFSCQQPDFDTLPASTVLTATIVLPEAATRFFAHRHFEDSTAPCCLSFQLSAAALIHEETVQLGKWVNTLASLACYHQRESQKQAFSLSSPTSTQTNYCFRQHNHLSFGLQ